MYEIPKPELLDPGRVDRDDREDMTREDHRSQAQLLAKALDQSCGYANQLWDQLDKVRGYLLASLPPDPRRPGPHVPYASPTGPDDDQGWQRWMDAFATTSSALCGAHGDSGLGLSTAKEEAQLRRTAPVLTTGAYRAELPPEHAPATASEASPPLESPAAARPAGWSALKIAGAVVAAALAVRGLRRTPSAR